MKNMLNTVKVDAPSSNTFDLTHDIKFSTKMGLLVPCLCMETIPGDKWHISTETLVRFMPLIAPLMHRVDVTVHYFFVANRLLWDNWEKFITNGGDQPMPTTVPAHPYYAVDAAAPQVAVGSLMDYIGLPEPTINGYEFNALGLAAYQKIWADYYRDENQMYGDPAFYKVIDGQNATLDIQLVPFQRAWEHDYFTSALPFAQKGAVVEIPVGSGILPVKYNLSSVGNLGATWSVNLVPGGGTNTGGASLETTTDPSVSSGGFYTENIGGGTMNDLRTAMRLQEWLEKNARGGTRYTEHLKMHWGVNSSDARLQRAEYITGIKTPVIISEVLNTTGADGGLPQGNMSGHAISAESGKQGSYYCEEHGWIIGIMNVQPKTAYFQGLHKQWQRRQPTDYAWPSFAHIGEQEILNNEVYIDHSEPLGVFGYIPRYAEYKVALSRIAGDMKTTLDYWHLARIFTSPDEPNLNNLFIESRPRSDIFAVDDGTDYLVCHVLNKLKVERKLPVFGTPTF